MEGNMSGGCGSGQCGCGSGQCGCGGARGGCGCKGGMMGFGMMRHMHRKPFMGLLVLAAVVYLILLSRNAAKQYGYIGRPTTQRDTITIAAEGKVTALPDIASVSVGVQTEKKSVSEAQKENTSKMNAIIAKLASLGVAKEDIKTVNYTIYPQYDYVNGKQVERGIQVSQNVDIKIRNLDIIGGILAAVGELGANQVGGVDFTLDDSEALRQRARLKGLEMAKMKAQALAEAAGVKLGKVVGFSESSGYVPGPIYYAKDMAAGMGGDGAAPSVEPGTQDVTVNVSVQYEIL